MNINSSDSFDCGHEECDEELKLLYLTRDDVLYIDDKLSMMIERDGKTESFTTVIPIIANAGLPAPVDLLDKIGMAVLEATDDHYDNELLPEICNMCGGINIEWSAFLATAYAEGICEGEDATEDEIISAWQYLVNTGLCWKLQGSFGRTAQALIEQGIIVSK